jgi:hypothetical protein
MRGLCRSSEVGGASVGGIGAQQRVPRHCGKAVLGVPSQLMSLKGRGRRVHTQRTSHFLTGFTCRA